ncbi:Salicylate hydroxylase [Lachnellula arida]|uniref:Salicylate hydroxylase n=1 Tax=Lachnellula arida TaxID=1316785 RepID=A0A8T9B7X5_9HELO|nr:Salicylate hydroxylase [Lachnellula arida]
MGFGDKRIAIIGGGLGGMAFANAALYAGLTNIQLYEQAPEFTEVGAGVNITKNANVVLDAYGLKEAMLWKSSHDPQCYMEYRNFKTGEVFGRVEEFGEPSSRQIHRAHLLEAMRSKVPGAILNTGKRLSTIQWLESSREYLLTFVDETTTTADIVIGCDGIKSTVRDHLGFTDHPNYSGQMVYRGYVAYSDLSPATALELRRSVIHRGKQRHILTLPIGNEESETARVAVIGFMTEPLESWVSESWMAKAPVDRLAEQVEGWTGTVQEVIAGLRKSAERDGNDLILKQALYVRDPLPKLYAVEEGHPGSGIILLGDSAHSTLPHQGQGTCMAIESGVALATILKNWKSDSLEDAFSFYQNLRKPRTDKVTQTSYEAGKLASADVPEGTSVEFNAEVLRERMKWIMDYNVLEDVFEKGAPYFEDENIQAQL